MKRRVGSGAIALLAFATALPAAAQTKPKAVFEPVSFSEDLDLRSVFFVDDDTGWASGEAGTVLHTADGGESWTAQLGGDPQGSESPIEDLRFLDRNTGWAVGGAEATVQRKLLGTTDGRSWRQVGVVGTPHGSYSDYAFISARDGFFLEAADVGAIYRTRDGGRNWEPALARCSAKVRLGGLNKDLTCSLKDLFFLTPELGWAVGAGSAGTIFVLRTVDGGASWEYLFVEPNLGHPDEPHFRQHVVFLDEHRGFLALPRADKLLKTEDGGRTWQVAPVAAVEGSLRFGDPEVGWNLGQEKLLCTANGGASWTSRALRFPADVHDFSVPSRRRAYVVGGSGMVFRYRVVDAAYQNPEALPAPLLPGVSDPLTPHLAAVARAAETLEGKLESAPAGEESSVGECCGTELAALDSGIVSFVADVPPVTARYRNLNLVLAGLQMISRLKAEADGMREAFRALKGAPDVATASTALQDLLARVEAAKGMIAEGFDAPPPLSATAPPPAEFVEPEPAEAPAAAAPAKPAASPTRKKLLGKLKEKLKVP